MAHGRRRQADRLRRGHGRRPDRLPSSTSGSRRSSTPRACAPRATATPTSAACTSGRSSTSRRGRGRTLAIDRRGGLRPGRRVRRRDERRARRRPGPEPLEPQALRRPRSTPAFEAVKRAFDPENRMNPGKVVAAPDGRPPPDRPRLSPPRAAERSRLLRPGGLRPRGRDVLGRRGLPQDRHRHHVPQLHGHPRRDALDPRPRQRPAAGDLRACPRAAWRRPCTALDLCLQCKACKSECPSQVDMAKLKAEFLPLLPLLPRRARWLASDGHHPINPIGSATARWPTPRQESPALSSGGGKAGRGSTADAHCPDLRPRPFSGNGSNVTRWIPPRQPRGGRPARRLLHDVQQRRRRDHGSARARDGRLRGPPGGVEVLRGRPAISKGLLKLGRDLARENVERLQPLVRQGLPDPRLRAELPGHPDGRVPRLFS